MSDGSFSSKMREVRLFGSVDDDTARDVVSAVRCLDLKKGPIHLVIASTGGDEGAGWAIYDALRLAHNDVVTEAYGSCQSIAALILQAGTTRLLSPDCRFMVHNGSIEMAATVTQMRSYGKEIQFLTQRYYEELAARSGLTVRRVRALCDRETFLSAAEAVDLGFADGIIMKPPKRGRRRA